MAAAGERALTRSGVSVRPHRLGRRGEAHPPPGSLLGPTQNLLESGSRLVHEPAGDVAVTTPVHGPGGNQRPAEFVSSCMHRFVFACFLFVSACGPADDARVVAGDGPSPSSRYQVSATVLESPDHGPQLCQGVEESYPPQCSGPDIVGWDWAGVEGEETANGTTWGTYQVTGTWDGTRLTLTDGPGPPQVEGPDGGVDLSTPCPQPDGGWQVVDEATATDEALAAVTGTARELPGFAGLWLDQSINPASARENPPEGAMNDPSRLVLNVRVTDELTGTEAELRRLWGGPLCVSPATRTFAELQAIQAELSGADILGSVIDESANVVEVQVIVVDQDLQAEYDARYGRGAVELTGWLQPVP